MRIIRLEAGDHQGAVRFLSDRVQLAEGKRTIVATVTRTGRFSDPRYGEFEITRKMLLSMVRNFVAHRPDNGAAGLGSAHETE